MRLTANWNASLRRADASIRLPAADERRTFAVPAVCESRERRQGIGWELVMPEESFGASPFTQALQERRFF